MSGIVGSRLNIRGSGIVGGLGTDGQVLTSAGAGQEITFEATSGGVDTSGTPANNQLAIFTDADTVEGSSNVVYDGTDMTLTGGNLIIGTAGKGIDFSAQTATSASNSAVVSTGEILDHYEEGTWTPRLTSATAGTTIITTGAYDSFYTRIGNRVFLSANFYQQQGGAGAVGASGALVVNDAPFTSMSTGTNYGFLDFNYFNVMFSTNDAVYVVGINTDNTSTFNLNKMPDDADGYMKLWTALIFSNIQTQWTHFSAIGQIITAT